MTKKGKTKKRRLKVKVLIKLLVFILIIASLITYIRTLNVKNIEINGTTYTKDADIIRAAGIENYPKIYKLNTNKITKNVKKLPLVETVTIKRNIFGKITFEIEESEILFYYKYNNKFITSSGSSIPNENNIIGLPTLINFTPDTVLDKFIKGLTKIDINIIKSINEIEYNPYKAQDGTIIDDSRFTLKMNDSNTVIIDTLNIKKLSKYNKIYSSLKMDEIKGTLYLDTITEENIYFESYQAAAETLEMQQQTEEEQEGE